MEVRSMSDATDLPERVERYVATHPNVSVPALLGRFDLPVEQRETVEALLATETTPSGSDTGDENVPETSDTEDEGPTVPYDQAQAALGALIDWFHEHLDTTITDHTETEEHPDRPTTARAYFKDERGWSDETIATNCLGWAPPEPGRQTVAFDHLRDQGHSPAAIRATGLFNTNDQLLWQGRYVFPYFDASGQPVYAIARCTGAKGGGAADYDGHPADYLSGKYAKVAHSREDVPFSEPIWGMHTLQDGEPVVVAEGIADAITAHAAGYPVLSPVAKEFKRDHFEEVLAAVETHAVSRVYVIPDAERAGFGTIDDAPTEPTQIRDAINIPKIAPGPGGGLRTAAFLADHDIDVRLVELPLLAQSEDFHKVDLDDYLHEWDETLQSVLHSARRPTPATFPTRYEKAVGTTGTDRHHQDPTDGRMDDETSAQPTPARYPGSNDNDSAGATTNGASALFTLDLTDLTGPDLASAGDRGPNPLGHTGDSENYFVLREGSDGDLVATDYKRPGEPVFHALTYLLVAAGKRSISAPEGSLTDEELYAAWKYAKANGHIPATDPIPLRALFHVLVADDYCASDEWVWRDTETGAVVSPDEIDDHEGDIRFGLPPGGAYNHGLDVLEQQGIEHGREPVGTGDDAARQPARQYGPETCVPPIYEPVPFETDQYRERLQNERYDAYLDDNGPHVWADQAGSGKSTTAELAAAERDHPYFAAFDKHAKGHATITSPVTPDDQFPLKGAEQPYHDCCMAAQAATVESHETEVPQCSQHGHPSNWQRMCPVYQLDQDNDVRQRFEALVSLNGPLYAHLALGLFDEDKHQWHDEECHWSAQFDELMEDGQPLAERIIGVHEYQLLKSATTGRDVIVDETPRLLGNDQRVTVDQLVTAQLRFETLADVPREDDDMTANLRALATFTEQLAHALAGDEPATFADIDVPDLQPITANETVDPDDLPADVDPADVERTTWREYKDPVGGHYSKHHRHVVERDRYDEPLAQLKLLYNEGLDRQIRDGELPGAPFCVDAIFAALTKTVAEDDENGFTDVAVRTAIAVPPILDTCPWCGSSLVSENGARFCGEEDCDWHEEHNNLIPSSGGPAPARAAAWLADDPAQSSDDDRPGLVYEQLPATTDLPTDPLILDATATHAKIAGFYGTAETDVTIRGDEPLDLDGKIHTTQIVGGYHGDDDRQYHAGGQYHAQTIKDTPSIQERMQTTIDRLCAVHNKPLFGIKRALKPLFEWPENAVVVYYGGARGLDYLDCDAVCCLGAPHPDMEDIKRKAELLAQDNPDLRGGGEEYSTRRDAPNPPVYRKLYYEDDDGNGLAVPTKAYSGLVGALFREARENELEQFFHRIRPTLVEPENGDAMKHAYLLTDVPTELPIDEVVGFEELADPLTALFPVADGALRMLGYGRDLLTGDAPDGFRAGASALIERRDDGTLANKAKGWRHLCQANGETVSLSTIYNWLDDLEDCGLLIPEPYEQHAGVSYTADVATLQRALQVLSSNAGLKVAAIRRFVEKVRAADGSLDWLAWAQEVFDLAGDRCERDPPPNPGG
jgi:hypothetical protein